MSDGDRAGVAVEKGHSHGRPHSGGGRILDRAAVDAFVRRLDELRDGVLTVDAALALGQRGRGEVGRELSRLRAAHAVRHGEQRWVADCSVFVAQPPPAGVGARRDATDPHDSTRSWVSPIRIRSPVWRSRGLVTWAPFTNEPFVEPRSSNQTPVSAGVIRAWRLET